MNTRKHLTIILALVLMGSLVLSACQPFFPTQGPTSADALYTAAAQTIVAQHTLAAGQTAVAQLTSMVGEQPTATSTAIPSVPTDTWTPPTATYAAPTAVWVPPTAVWVPPTQPWYPPTWTPRPQPTATPVPVRCDWAQYVNDITVPDGTTFLPGQTFTKIWRMRNIGSCTWNSSYTLVYVSGDRFHNTRAVPLPKVVKPGNVVDLAIEMTAPVTAGHYRSYWMITNQYGETFGIGERANKAFWVDINVSQPESPHNYDFALNMCTASWRSSAGTLPCPGDEDSSAGSVILLTSPKLETGKTENEPTLWTRPHQVNGGWIMGVYPVYKVKSGDHFMADIGCLANSTACDVTFNLSYQVQGQPVKSLGSWWERYEGNFTRLDIDLAHLTGQKVQFMLSVTNNGKASAANAFWLAPSIRTVTAPPTPIPEWDVQPAVKAAVAKVSGATGIPANLFVVTSAKSVEWPDSCLGIHSPERACLMVITPGYLITMMGGGREFEAHTNSDGSAVYWFEK